MNYEGGEYDTSAIYSAIQKQTVVRPHVDCEYFDGQQYIKVAKKKLFCFIYYYYYYYFLLLLGVYGDNLGILFFWGCI